MSKAALLALFVERGNDEHRPLVADPVQYGAVDLILPPLTGIAVGLAIVAPPRPAGVTA
ncbi:hypothetical protein [Streptodolium elevatio]